MSTINEVSTTTPTIQRTTESPPPPTPRRRWNGKKWRARLVVVLMIAAAGFGGSRLADSRGHTLTQFGLGTVTLSAQSIPVAADQSGQVSSVDVIAQQHVSDGQRLGTIVVTSTTATGKQRQKSVPLTAPADGVVVGNPVPVGSVLALGEPFAVMYDPAALTLNTTVRVEDLPQLSAGMAATLRADGLDQPIQAVVQRVEPRVAGAAAGTGNGKLPSSSDRLELVLVPRQPADVAGLVPGLRLTGTVDTRSGTGAPTDMLHVTG
jgi:multidrug resistance efflux pump